MKVGYAIIKNYINCLHNKLRGDDHRCHIWAAIWAAMIMASFMLVFEKQGYFDGLDNLMLTTVQGLPKQTNSDVPLASVHQADIPIELVIGGGLYETEFHETSPLNVSKISNLIENVLRQSPKLLAVDIDLSPTLLDPEEREVDETLIRYAEKSKVVLVVPMAPISSTELRIKKIKWMKHLCENNINFAYSDLNLNHALFLKYNPKVPTLGIVAAKQIEESSDEVHPAEHGGHTAQGRRGEVTLCADFRNPEIKEEDLVDFFFDRKPPTDPKGMEPINYDYFDLAKGTRRLLEASANIGENLSGQVVFLGGAYNAQDTVMTPTGEELGMTAHAAVFYAQKYPIKNTSHAGAFWGDVFLGTLLGLFFAWCWKRAYEDKISHVMLVLPFVALSIVIYLISLGMSWFIQHQLWMNPAPILIGVFLDSYKTAVETAVEKAKEAEKRPHEGDKKISTNVLLDKLDWALSQLFTWGGYLLVCWALWNVHFIH